MAKSSSGTGAQKPPTFDNKGTSGAFPRAKSATGPLKPPFESQRSGKTARVIGGKKGK